MCLSTPKSPNVYSNCYAASEEKQGKAGKRLVKQDKKKNEERKEREKWKERQSRGKEGLKDQF